MRILPIAAAALLAACGQPADEAANQAAANAAQPKKKKPAHCFFKDSETRGWAAKRGKDGNITVTGEAYRSDSRYKAVLGPVEVDGATASIAPTIIVNDTGYGAQDDWWEVSATLPNSAAITTVNVKCGATTIGTFNLPARSQPAA